MESDEIIEIGINRSNQIYVKPKSHNFSQIYRAAREVNWDRLNSYLHSPSDLKNWNHFKWFRHIIFVIKTEANCNLLITEKTIFINIPEELIVEITKLK